MLQPPPRLVAQCRHHTTTTTTTITINTHHHHHHHAHNHHDYHHLHHHTTTSTQHSHHQHGRNTPVVLPPSSPRRRAHRPRRLCHAMLQPSFPSQHTHRHSHRRTRDWANYVRRVRKRDLSGLYIASSDHTTHPGTAVRSYGARNHDRLFCGSLKEPAPFTNQ